MSQHSSDTRPAAASVPRPSFAPATLIFLGIWACVFAAFVVLGLRS